MPDRGSPLTLMHKSDIHRTCGMAIVWNKAMPDLGFSLILMPTSNIHRTCEMAVNKC